MEIKKTKQTLQPSISQQCLQLAQYYVSPHDTVPLLHALRPAPDQGKIGYKEQFKEVYSWKLSGNLKIY